MTKRTERTLYEEYAGTPEGALELAAASLATSVVRSMNAAVRATGVENQKLAERLGVTKSRVSQLLNGDGNVRISSLAKVMRALGYQIELVVTPAESGVQELRAARSRKRANVAQEPCIWKQDFLSGDGVTTVDLLLEYIDDSYIPVGTMKRASEDKTSHLSGGLKSELSGTRLWRWDFHSERTAEEKV